MGKSWNIRRSSAAALAAAALALPLAALELPSGAEIEIRLKTKVSSQTSKPGGAVEAVVIAPVMAAGEFAIPAGALVRGTIEQVSPSTKPDERAQVALRFGEIETGGAKTKIAAQVAAVDNGRETVDSEGRIVGILASETITSKLDAGLDKLGQRYSGFADILGAAKKAVLKPAEGEINYDPGVEMTLKLTAPLKLATASGPGPAADLKPLANEAALVTRVASEPFQTVAQNPPKPSDITNVLLIGTEEQVRQAFAAAGWSEAAGLNAQAKLETFRALAENRGYSEAPVSVLLLEGKPPAMVFEKMNNTFAHRHHLRVWPRPPEFGGRPVWAVAATHDTGISFSEQNRTFIHLIDSSIDRERAKVVNDLLFTGRVESLALVERPAVPQHGQNATGDNIETDGKIAVLVLK
jgi:hypothetical protein